MFGMVKLEILFSPLADGMQTIIIRPSHGVDAPFFNSLAPLRQIRIETNEIHIGPFEPGQCEALIDATIWERITLLSGLEHTQGAVIDGVYLESTEGTRLRYITKAEWGYVVNILGQMTRVISLPNTRQEPASTNNPVVVYATPDYPFIPAEYKEGTIFCTRLGDAAEMQFVRMGPDHDFQRLTSTDLDSMGITTMEKILTKLPLVGERIPSTNPASPNFEMLATDPLLRFLKHHKFTSEDFKLLRSMDFYGGKDSLSSSAGKAFEILKQAGYTPKEELGPFFPPTLPTKRRAAFTLFRAFGTGSIDPDSKYTPWSVENTLSHALVINALRALIRRSNTVTPTELGYIERMYIKSMDENGYTLVRAANNDWTYFKTEVLSKLGFYDRMPGGFSANLKQMASILSNTPVADIPFEKPRIAVTIMLQKFPMGIDILKHMSLPKTSDIVFEPIDHHMIYSGLRAVLETQMPQIKLRRKS